MRTLNKRAERTFRRLIDGANDDGYRKIDNSRGFMAVCIQRVGTTTLGPIWSVAHYYEQNGDLMADPDITFIAAPYGIIADTFRQDSLGINRAALVWNDAGEISGYRKRQQADLTTFANTWMANIAEQQGV